MARRRLLGGGQGSSEASFPKGDRRLRGNKEGTLVPAGLWTIGVWTGVNPVLVEIRYVHRETYSSFAEPQD
jgi:hypothetical protein